MMCAVCDSKAARARLRLRARHARVVCVCVCLLCSRTPGPYELWRKNPSLRVPATGARVCVCMCVCLNQNKWKLIISKLARSACATI